MSPLRRPSIGSSDRPRLEGSREIGRRLSGANYAEHEGPAFPVRLPKGYESADAERWAAENAQGWFYPSGRTLTFERFEDAAALRDFLE